MSSSRSNRIDPALLAQLGRRTHVSQSGLVQVLKELSEMGELASEPPSRQSIKRARTAAACRSTVYGAILVFVMITLLDPLADSKLTYLQPASLLRWLSEESLPFREFLTAVWMAYPCSQSKPWRIVVYADEVLPGNQLKHVNLRKLQAIYWSILEFGVAALSLEQFWFTLTVCRSKIVERCPGGMSAIFRILIAAFFDSNIADFFEGGVVVRLSHGYQTLVMKMGAMISDLAAFKQVIQHKGHNGSLFCLECRNVIDTTSRIRQPRDAEFKLCPATETNVNNFIVHTDASIVETVQYLHAEKSRMNKGTFNKEQQYLGFNYVPEGILLDRHMNKLFPIISLVMFDWMHIYFVHGIFQLVVGLMLNRFATLHMGHSIVHEFVSRFVWPSKWGGKSNDGRSVFEKRSSGAIYLQCQASEGLSVYPIFELFCKLYITNKFTQTEDDICECYYLLCSVIRMLRNLPNHRVDPAKLLDKTVQFLKKFIEVWGADEWIPKCHFAIHVPLHYMKFQRFLLNCWVLERKHKYAKNVANKLCNTNAPEKFEVPILEDILFHQLDFLRKPCSFPTTRTRLVNAQTASRASVQLLQQLFGSTLSIATVLQSKEAANGVIHFHAGDIAFAKVDNEPCVVEIINHYWAVDLTLSLVVPWTRVSTYTFTPSDQPVFVSTTDLIDLCISAPSEVDNVQYVVPCKY